MSSTLREKAERSRRGVGLGESGRPRDRESENRSRELSRNVCPRWWRIEPSNVAPVWDLAGARGGKPITETPGAWSNRGKGTGVLEAPGLNIGFWLLGCAW